MPSSAAAETEQARVAASFGRQFYVRSCSGAWDERVAVTRGKRTDVCVGDEVEVRLIGADQAVIESLRPRRTALQRSDRWRSKLLAANVDQAGIVVAGEPPFSEALLVRMLIAIESAGIGAALIVNKSDLPEAMHAIAARIDVYRALGYRVFEIAARTHPLEARAQLRDWLAGRTTLLIGQSGMGKSTLVNTLVPDAALRTQAISVALSSGRHTTTFSRMFEVPAGVAPDARIVDTPGFQSFGLAHLSQWQRVHAMREFVPLLGRCRFNDCHHRDEPACAIREAVERGEIDPLRYRLYLQIEGEPDQDS
ncbi:MAG: ribosome small subunit-dependent GTPase A [Burkholderiaceae bacterium]|nr:ribosome small subunit-dependent GTPase A [Burkholderiaceae bacterium]